MPIDSRSKETRDLAAQVAELRDEVARLRAQVGGSGLTFESNNLASVVTWANVPDANITASSVVQHQGEDWDFSGEMLVTGTFGAFGASAVGQQSSPSAQSSSAVSGSGDDSTINDNFSAHDTAINAITTALENLGWSA